MLGVEAWCIGKVPQAQARKERGRNEGMKRIMYNAAGGESSSRERRGGGRQDGRSLPLRGWERERRGEVCCGPLRGAPLG